MVWGHTCVFIIQIVSIFKVHEIPVELGIHNYSNTLCLRGKEQARVHFVIERNG
jgi:hypothetical protein